MRLRNDATLGSTRLPLAAVAALALLCACAGNEREVDASPPAADQGAPTLEQLEVDVPTVQQAEASAAESIDASNADAEFEKLKEEIESDT